MTSHESFVADIEAFLKRTGMSATAFGRAAVGDPNLVRDLRGGEGRPARMPSLRLVERVNSFMASPSQPEEDAACEAAADGKVTPIEAKRIERAATDLDDANELLSADMRRIQAGDRA